MSGQTIEVKGPKTTKSFTATDDVTLTVEDGKVVVEQGRRITARHVRQLEKDKITEIVVPDEYMLDRAIAHDIVDQNTGEVVFECNSLITMEVIEKIREMKLERIEVIYSNDLDCGPFIADTLRTDHLDAWGYDRETAPFLTSLAAEGMRFCKARRSS